MMYRKKTAGVSGLFVMPKMKLILNCLINAQMHTGFIEDIDYT